MSKMIRFLVGCEIIALVFAAAEVRAVTQVASPAQLNGPLVVEDFEDATFVSGVTFSASSGIFRRTSGDASAGVTTSGIWGLSTINAPDPISMSFALAQPAKSAGFFFGNDDVCCSTGFTAFLDIYGTSGLLDTIGVQANMNDFVDQFLGFNSATPVVSLTLRYGSGSDVSLYHYIDDFQFSVVPEPSGLVLTGLSCVGAVVFARPAGRRWRRRREL